jgi:predicted nucleic acid-binding Zn ribbon protein
MKVTKYSPKNPKNCTICGTPFYGNSSNQRTCSPECSLKLATLKQRERYEKKKVLKGYNQKGENNNIFHKKGTPQRKMWVYQKYRKDHCEFCGLDTLDTKLTFIVHHRDENPLNNAPENLITLCHRCHKLVHRGKIDLDKV